MYDLKPILKPVHVELPTCMYPMKPVIQHGASGGAVATPSSTVFMDLLSEKIKILLLKVL